MWKQFKAWMRERRIKRFRARLKEAYPDAAKLIERVSWLSEDDLMLNAWIHVHDCSAYRQLTPEEKAAIDRSFEGD